MHLFLILSTYKHVRVRRKEKWQGLLFILTLSAPNPFFIADESVSSLFIVNQFGIYLLLISLGFSFLLPTRLNLRNLYPKSLKHT